MTEKSKPRQPRTIKAGTFTAPFWALEPSKQTASCLLEVFKEEGVILKRLNLGKKSTFILGRHKACDEVLEHVSLSRTHAVFIHCAKHEAGGVKQKPRKDANGEEVEDMGIVLVDLHSSHGTFVNEEKIPPGVAVLIFDYDVIRFGGSLRKYKAKGLGVRRPGGYPLVYQPPENAPLESKDTSSKKSSKEGVSPKSHKRSRDETDKHKKHKKKKESEKESPKEKSVPEPEKVRCSHILVKWSGSRNPSSRLEKTITRSKDEALELVKKYRKQVQAKEKTFEEIALESSHCPTGAKSQGDLGFFARGRMQRPFEDASFNLKVGEVSEPIWTDSGVHLIKRIE